MWLFIVGCSNSNDQFYNESIQSGFDYLAAEEYIRAELQFEQALENKPNDSRAEALFLQTKHYNNALKATENNDDESILNETEKVIEIKEGSEALKAKAESLIKQLHKRNEIENEEVVETVEEVPSELPNSEPETSKEWGKW